MATPRQTGRPLGNSGRDERERSLCRERFRGHNELISSKDGLKHNQNLRDTQKAYAIVWFPNIC